jgi:hypothetical protein
LIRLYAQKIAVALICLLGRVTLSAFDKTEGLGRAMTSAKATKGLKANGCTPLYRKVQIKGKYLDTIASSVSSLTLSPEWLPPNSKALLALAEVIAGIQPAFQSKTFAAVFLVREFDQFVNDHDACYSDNQTLAYLAACIGLEALLGGGDEHLDDMSRRLADRYAYMLGKARSARQMLQSDYLEILKVRGRLVHARDSRLSGDALGSLERATNMLARVIRHELEQFLRQVRNTKARQVNPQGQ